MPSFSNNCFCSSLVAVQLPFMLIIPLLLTTRHQGIWEAEISANFKIAPTCLAARGLPQAAAIWP